VAMKHFAGHAAVWVIDPIALGLLVLMTYAALDKRRLPLVWRRIHKVNHILFVAIFLKTAIIGTDVRTLDATAHIMRAVMVLYVVIAAAAMGVRVADYGQAAPWAGRPAGKVDDGST